MHTVQKFNSILKLHSLLCSANRLIAPQITTLIRNNLQLSTKPVLLQSSQNKTLVHLAPQLTPKNIILNPQSKMSILTRMPFNILKPQFTLNKLSWHKSHSINKIVANGLQKSDNKEYEQSEQLDPNKTHF